MKPSSSKTMISADGKCLTNPISELECLILVIDGKRITGSGESQSLIESSAEHSPKSIHYQLIAFEPQQDGTCIAKYARVNKDNH